MGSKLSAQKSTKLKFELKTNPICQETRELKRGQTANNGVNKIESIIDFFSTDCCP
jgi:hypothetical protein